MTTLPEDRGTKYPEDAGTGREHGGVSGYTNTERPDQRLSDAERDEAVARLAAARSEGRLTASENQERASAARAAVTRADLAPLFADLPEPAPASVGGTSNSAMLDSVSSRALGGRVGATIMALTPFVAVALFFLSGFLVSFVWAWLWFLLIPVAGIIIYGPGSGRRSESMSGDAGASDTDARRPRALGGAIGVSIMALVPFVALGLFFVFGFGFSFALSWLWFLIIPVAAIIIFGPGSDSRSGRS